MTFLVRRVMSMFFSYIPGHALVQEFLGPLHQTCRGNGQTKAWRRLFSKPSLGRRLLLFTGSYYPCNPAWTINKQWALYFKHKIMGSVGCIEWLVCLPVTWSDRTKWNKIQLKKRNGIPILGIPSRSERKFYKIQKNSIIVNEAVFVWLAISNLFGNPTVGKY